jgi:hypothetical protein
MATNGAAALHLVPAPESKAAAVGKPSEPIEIGAAVADAVVVFFRAILDTQQSGILAPATKNAGGDRIAALALLQLDYAGGDSDFVARAHRDGKRELRRCFNNTDLFQQHDPVEIDKVFDTSISDVLGIVTRVVKDERTYRLAWAN